MKVARKQPPWQTIIGLTAAALLALGSLAFGAHLYEGTVWPPIYKWDGVTELSKGETGQAMTAGGEIISYETMFDARNKVVLVFAGPYPRLVGVGKVHDGECAEYWIDYGVSVGDKLGNYKALDDWGPPDWRLHLNECNPAKPA